MVKAMCNNAGPGELDQQQDALDCIQYLIGNIIHLQMLRHHFKEEYICDGCKFISHSDLAMPVALVPIKTKITNGIETFSATDAITEFFQNPENVDKNCENCVATTCIKQITLKSTNKYIVVQFKRYSMKRTRESKKENNCRIGFFFSYGFQHSRRS